MLVNFRLGGGIGKRSPASSFHKIIYRSLGTELANMCEIGSILNQVYRNRFPYFTEKNPGGDRLRDAACVKAAQKPFSPWILSFLRGLALACLVSRGRVLAILVYAIK